MKKGLVHIYCGEGKGKTTSAIGMGIRACGWGLRVLMVQFFKGADTGELKFLESVPLFTVIGGPRSVKFYQAMSEEEKQEYKITASGMFHTAVHVSMQDKYDLLILDEVFAAVNTGMVEQGALAGFLMTQPAGLEVVMTGRYAPKELIEAADLVTEMVEVKHYYAKGVGARDGIER